MTIRQNRANADWTTLRLRDRIAPGVTVLFVGINPGVRSALTGHHFAGYSNRFWKLLYESGLVPEPIGHEDDDRLGEWGYGITNLVARATPGIDSLRPEEYVAGWRTLERKIRRHKPAVVALIGVTLYRAIARFLVAEHLATRSGAARVHLGRQPITICGATLFVLPNPSGRNANFSYQEMLAAFRALARFSARRRRDRAARAACGAAARRARRR
jgi:TDG/mug DNA glycosylase family protein